VKRVEFKFNPRQWLFGFSWGTMEALSTSYFVLNIGPLVWVFQWGRK